MQDTFEDSTSKLTVGGASHAEECECWQAAINEKGTLCPALRALFVCVMNKVRSSDPRFSTSQTLRRRILPREMCLYSGNLPGKTNRCPPCVCFSPDKIGRYALGASGPDRETSRRLIQEAAE